jgi:hypothetical protein
MKCWAGLKLLLGYSDCQQMKRREAMFSAPSQAAQNTRSAAFQAL